MCFHYSKEGHRVDIVKQDKQNTSLQPPWLTSCTTHHQGLMYATYTYIIRLLDIHYCVQEPNNLHQMCLSDNVVHRSWPGIDSGACKAINKTIQEDCIIAASLIRCSTPHLGQPSGFLSCLHLRNWQPATDLAAASIAASSGMPENQVINLARPASQYSQRVTR